LARDTHLEETMATTSEKEALAREMIERIADKWTMLVLDALEPGEQRFTRIREQVGHVSQKMLTKTLRQLERDGLVTRTVYPVVPPHVEYKLTPLGLGLAESFCAVWKWADRHGAKVQEARRRYDARPAAAPRKTA
jgi:DNA-binding HxlR family transcriptional regulator